MIKTKDIENILIFYEDRHKWTERMAHFGYKKKHLTLLSQFLEPSETIQNLYVELKAEKDKRNLPITILLFEAEEISKLNSKIKSLHGEKTIIWNITDGIFPYIGSFIPGYAKLNRIGYFGNSTYAQSIAQDKFVFTTTCENLNISTPRTILSRGKKILSRIPPSFSECPLYFVKPRNLDNEIGIDQGSCCKSLDAALSQSEKLFKLFGVDALIQEYIEGLDIRVTYLNIDKNKNIIDLIGVAKRHPSDKPNPFRVKKNVKLEGELTDESPAEIIRLAMRLVTLLSLKDIFSFDFRIDSLGNYYMLEMNTSPFISGSEFQEYVTGQGLTTGGAMLAALLNSSLSNNSNGTE